LTNGIHDDFFPYPKRKKIMAYQPEAADNLKHMKFPASTVCKAAEVTSSMLENFALKAGLVLCSQSPGRGRARQYCLIDVYQIRIMAELVALTGYARWSARALNDYLGQVFVPARIGAIKIGFSTLGWSGAPEIRNQFKDLCVNIDRAPPAYLERIPFSPWLLWTSKRCVDRSEGQLIELRGEVLLENLAFENSGYFVNVSRLLDEVDRRLLDAMQEG
jgi:hypothetical protein